MKSIKRIIALLLTAVMTMTMSVTAFAADANNLTVNVLSGQDLNGQTISLYKLFDVTTSGSGENKNYAYTVNTATGYKDAIKSALGTSFSGTTDVEYAEAVKTLGEDKSAPVQKFANDFTEYALKNGTTVKATKTSGKITGKNTTSFVFNGLDKGYYLVYVTGGKKIQSSLVTVDGETTVSLKTEAPSITKTADKETVSIGQVVKYTVAGSVPDTTGYAEYVYKIHDTLSNGLDFVNDAKGTAVTGNTVNVSVAFKNATDASTAPTTATLDTTKKTMALDLSAWVRANQTNKGKEFTVTYYAKVNKDAVVTEKNSATLEYGNNPSDTTTTTPSEAKTPTYPLAIKKFAKNGGKTLAGAKFKLYSNKTDADAANENAIKVLGSNGNYVVDSTSPTTEFVSVDSITGQGYNLHVNGLAEGTYYLVETKAPDGFNKLTAPIVIKITKSTDTDVNKWTISKDGTVEKDKIIDVENSTGSILPSTGGMGTIAFTVVAALLVLGVAVSFIRDRKREN
ncbi:isopeptide-forming domain-containing fimbrial protein [Catenibacterium sp. AM22-15]|uniref:SpaH/EbpB family LPXTG-anchored major pilin n=1 Tax=unclassified Catenibacterium TaxID=2643636 RepID=UPI000E3F309B|nr:MULTISPECIES: SpaH/EbpB family LPXTG-anchored major pilin [unclassified Catenibacterium]RGE97772.1 isopeptide-forming domain-containing fimbrial protein [Catenibacterium sp. AM22-6LB]RGF05735.1 isopeptide-forming domain-containing fimbrial protein [Catenibacterium sp. AM22-15]